MNVLAGLKAQTFPLSANHGGRPGVKSVFRTEYASRNKVTSRNISATTDKQKALWERIEVNLGTPKTAFFMRNLPIDTRNLGLFPNKQDHSKKSKEGHPLFPDQ